MTADQDEQIILLSLIPSPFAMSVKMALAEKGVKYQVFEEDAAIFPGVKTDLLLRSNPVHEQVPVLIHRGLPVAESLVILEYIEETWPASSDGLLKRTALLPESPYERSIARFWADFCNKKFWETSLLIMKKLDNEQIQAWNDTAQLYITLDREMTKLPYGKPFLFGEHLTIPDLVLAPLASWITVYEGLANRKFPDAKECPRLSEWLDAISKHPNVKCAIADPKMMLDNAIYFQQRLRDKAIGVGAKHTNQTESSCTLVPGTTYETGKLVESKFANEHTNQTECSCTLVPGTTYETGKLDDSKFANAPTNETESSCTIIPTTSN